MKKSLIKKILLSVVALTVAVLLVVPSFKKDEISAASTDIVLDAGTADEFTIHSNDTGTVETLPPGYVQNTSVKPSFTKVTIKSTSLHVGSEIAAVYEMSDGTFLGIMVAATSIFTAPHRVTTGYVVKMDAEGNILAVKNIATLKEDFSFFYGQSSNAGEYFWYNGSFQQDADTIAIIAQGDVLNQASPYTDRYYIVDKDLNIIQNDVNRNGFAAAGQNIAYISNNNGSVYRHGYTSASSANQTTFEVYKLDSVGKYESMAGLKVPNYTDMIANKPYNWYMALAPGIVKTDTGYIGIVQAYNFSYRGETVERVYVWDDNGNIVKFFEVEDYPVAQKFLNNNPNSFYFLNREAQGYVLKKVDSTTNTISDLHTYPTGTLIQIAPYTDTKYNTNYTYYGTIDSTIGEFSPYGSTGGVVNGTLNDDFSVHNAGIVAANGNVKINDFKQITGTNLFFVAGRTSATDFSEEPTGGWINISDSPGDAFHGVVMKSDDYSPSIKVDSTKVINIETSASVNDELLSDVVVNDAFDLSPSGGNRTMADLRSRINYNTTTNTPVAWSDLGIDTTKVGASEVTYFVTDYSGQQTVTSRIVNLIDNDTLIDPTNTLALNASNFTISLQDAPGLTETLVKDVNHANVSAWNMTTTTSLTNLVTINAAQLTALNNATVGGAFPLKLSVTENGITIEKTIMVFVTDGTTVESVVANAFTVNINDVATLDNNQIKTRAGLSAWNINTGTQIDNATISVSGVILAKVGPYRITFTTQAGTAKQVVASVIDDTIYIDPTFTYAIFANHFTVDRSVVSTLTSDNVITRASAYAWNIETGNPVTLTVDFSSVKARVGAYPVVFTANNATATVNVSVVGVDPVLPITGTQDIFIFTSGIALILIAIRKKFK